MPPARSNPTARRGRNYLEFFEIFMNIGTELSTLSIGHNIEWPVMKSTHGCRFHVSNRQLWSMSSSNITLRSDFENYGECDSLQQSGGVSCTTDRFL